MIMQKNVGMLTYWNKVGLLALHITHVLDTMTPYIFAIMILSNAYSAVDVLSYIWHTHAITAVYMYGTTM